MTLLLFPPLNHLNFGLNFLLLAIIFPNNAAKSGDGSLPFVTQLRQNTNQRQAAPPDDTIDTDNGPKFEENGEGSKNEHLGDREENTESRETREGRRGKKGGGEDETDIHRRGNEHSKESSLEKSEETREPEGRSQSRGEKTEEEPPEDLPRPYESHYSSYSSPEELPQIIRPVPFLPPPRPLPIVPPLPTVTSPTTTTRWDRGVNCPQMMNLCTNELYRTMMAKNCAGTCAGQDNNCLDGRPDLCPHWIERGFCHSTFYSEKAKIDFCARSCGFCRPTTIEPIIVPVIIPVPVMPYSTPHAPFTTRIPQVQPPPWVPEVQYKQSHVIVPAQHRHYAS